MKSKRLLLTLVLLLLTLLVFQTCSATPCSGYECSGSDPYDSGYYVPTSIVSISHSVTTPSSSKPSGTAVDYHVQSKADKLEGYTPLNVHFWDESYASAGVTAVGWEWDLGDGTKETKKDFTHTYTTPGTFKVIPKVRFSDGKVSTGQAAAIRAYQPVASTTSTSQPTPSGTGGQSVKPSGTDVDYHVKSKADKLEGFAPLTIKFSDESYATKGVVPVGYEWNMGDGTTKKEKEFSHTYSVPGTYTVTPTVTFSDGKVSVGSSAKIVVSEGKTTPTVTPTKTPEITQAATPSGTLPDLTINTLNPASTVKPGETFSVEVTVTNKGGDKAGPFIIGGWVFPVENYQKDVKLEEISVSGLGSGETITKTLTGKIPGTALTGKYDLKVYADNSNYTDEGQVKESNENNNEKWFRDVKPTVTAQPTPVPPECSEYSCGLFASGYELPTGESESVIGVNAESDCDTVQKVVWIMPDGSEKTTANEEEIPFDPEGEIPEFTIYWESGKTMDGSECGGAPPTATQTPTPATTPIPRPVTLEPTPAPHVDYYVIARDNPVQGEAPLTVDFTDMSYATSGITPAAWKWDLGDGSTKSEQSFSHTFTSPGVYRVTDTVTFSDGHVLTGILTPDIRVVEYYPKMTATPTEGEAPLVVTFKDSSSASTGVYPVAWAWSFNDGIRDIRSNKQTFTHTFTKPGIFSWTGGVVYSDGKTSTQQGVITVSQKVIPEEKVYYYAELAPEPQSGEAPLLVSFEDKSYATHGVTVAHLSSDLGDGTTITDEKTFTHNYPDSGTYDVRHTVTYSDGEILVVGGPIKVYETIKYYVQISVAPLYGIAPLPVTFTDHSYATGGVYVTQRDWDFGDGNTGSGKITSHTYETAGTYTVKETVTFSDGYVQESNTRKVVVVEPEKSEGIETSDWEVVKDSPTEYYLIQTGEPREGFAPLTVRLEDQSSTNKPDIVANGWNWDLGDGQTSSEQKFTHEYLTEGIYEVSVTTTFSDGHEQAGEPIVIEVLKEGIETSSFTSDYVGEDAPEEESPVGPSEVTPEVTPEETQEEPVEAPETTTPDEQPPMMKAEEPSDTRCVEDEIFAKTNEMYTGGDYVRDSFLDEMARQYSALLCEKDKNKLDKDTTFTHDLIGKAPDGLKTRFEMSGYKYTCIAENIGHNPVLIDGSGCTDTSCTDATQKIMDGWKNSPPHYKNIMNQNGICENTKLGVGVFECGDGCYYATQIFATPADENQKPEKGKITITSEPSGAAAYIDGRMVGTTPTSSIEVIPGFEHTITGTLAGYPTVKTTQSVKPGEEVEIPLTFDTSAKKPEGKIVVTSVPDGAEVTIDGNPAGTTPTNEITVAEGDHVVEVKKSGYKSGKETAQVKADEVTEVSVTLTEIGPDDAQTTLSVISIPEAAEISIDGTNTGATPVTGYPVQPGTHQIIATKPGYISQTKTVSVIEGDQASETITLVREQPPLRNTGAITFTSDPSGAMIELNGMVLNQVTPVTITNIPTGTYQARFILENAISPLKSATVIADQTASLSHVFEKDNDGNIIIIIPGGDQGTDGQPGIIDDARAGTLVIETLPSGADVYINNWPAGRTLLNQNIAPGDYRISLRKEGYKPEIVTAVIRPGGQVFITRSLTPLSADAPVDAGSVDTFGKLDISSSPQGAAITLNGFEIGAVTPVILTDLMPGTYTVGLVLDGYEPFTQDVEVTPKETVTIQADLLSGEDNFDPLANLGTIKVTSSPEGADIFLNGFMQPDKSPVDLTLINPGQHYVELKLEGYDTYKEDVTMPSGGIVEVNAVLSKGGDEDATFTAEGDGDEASTGDSTDAGMLVIGDSIAIKSDPAISGSKTIWSQIEDGKSIVYIHDADTGIAEPVTFDEGGQKEPSMSGDYATWTTGGAESDVILKNLITGEIIRVTDDSIIQKTPYTDGISLVYVEEGDFGSRYDIVLYTIASGERTVIASGESEKKNPAVHRDYIVYEDVREGTSNVYLYTISSESEQVISEGGERMNPDISGEKIVYEDWRDDNADIYLFDISSGIEQVITSAIGDQVRPSIHGNMITFEDLNGPEPQIMSYSTDTGEISRIAAIQGSGYSQIREGGLVFLDIDGLVIRKMILS